MNKSNPVQVHLGQTIEQEPNKVRNEDKFATLTVQSVINPQYAVYLFTWFLQGALSSKFLKTETDDIGSAFWSTYIATKIACSQTLFFLFKVHRARMIKNKNVLEKNEKNRTTSIFLIFRFGFNNHESFTKARKQHESLHESFTKARLGILVPVPFLFRVDPQKPPKMAAVLALQESTRQVPVWSHLNPSSNPTVNESWPFWVYV